MKCIWLMLVTCLTIGTYLSASDEIFTNKQGIANEGYDVVAYFSLKPTDPAVMGDSNISTNYEGVTYHFSSEENKQQFLKDADKYLPQYGGYCAYAVAVNESKVKIDPNAWTIDNGKLYLNYDQNVREKWLSKKQQYIEDANRVWPTIKDKAFKKGWLW